VLPKPVVIDEINPRHITQATTGIYTTNLADLDFEHLTLNNNVSMAFQCSHVLSQSLGITDTLDAPATVFFRLCFIL